MLSLNKRVIIAASLVLAGFFGLAGFALDNIYRSSATKNVKQQLLNHIVTLIAATELNEQGGIYIPDILSEAPVNTVLRRFYALVYNHEGQLIWQSLSAKDAGLTIADFLSRNEHNFRARVQFNTTDFAIYSLGVAWGDENVDQNTYTFSAAQDLVDFDAQIARYRQNLWGWLGGVSLLLLFVQWRILKWGLFPLVNVAQEISDIKQGRQVLVKKRYPKEIEMLTDKINNLLQHQEQHLLRYRNSLGDLAHSLKTPVAILLNAPASKMDNDTGRMLREQLNRIVQITEYQLQRAAIVGASPLVAPINVQIIVEKLFAGLHKVYADKVVTTELKISKDIIFFGDEGDLYEILGNLADNAFKWCASRVNCVINNSACGEFKQGLFIQIDDDGSGISDESAYQIFKRGVRGDYITEGQGIGLSVVKDIVEQYKGEIKYTRSDLGGARFSLCMPHQA